MCARTSNDTQNICVSSLNRINVIPTCDYRLHVTVLIPVYNRESFIGDAIDSVVAQDYQDWDILVVDDGSTDRTVEIVNSKLSDDRISLIQMSHRGLTASTATGIEHARGPVITNLDSDDRLMTESLSTVLPAFEGNPRLGYVWTNWIDSTGEKGASDFPLSGRTLFESLISGWWGASAQRFYRKEFYLQSVRLDTSIQYAEDLQLALLLAKTGCDTLHIPKITYWRRIHQHRMQNELSLDEQSKAMHQIRRRFVVGSPRLLDLYSAEMDKERYMLRNELLFIKSCFGYKFMRLYGSMIDGALPDGTRRGKLREKIVDRIRQSYRAD